MITQDLGIATAYGYAKSKGYTGTEAEFAELMASYASVAQSAAASATAAAGSATSAASSANTASTAASTATTKASEASTSATNASGSASSAASSASAASGSATSAAASATTASGKASEATTAATTATTAKTDAVAAKTAAETAKTAAETAQGLAEDAQAAAEEAAASVTASAAQIEQNAEDITAINEALTTKANADGSYDTLTAGSAKQLLSNLEQTDMVPYNYRTAGGSLEIGDREKLKKIVGGSLAVNQLVNPDFSSPKVVNGVTYTKNVDGSISVSGESTGRSNIPVNTEEYINIVQSHKYLIAGNPSGASQSTYYMALVGYTNASYAFAQYAYTDTIINNTHSTANHARFEICGASASGVSINVVFYPQLFDLTQMFGTTIADYIYSLETATAGAGVAWLKAHFPRIFDAGYIPYNAGTLEHVSGLSAHKMTGFNQFDKSTAVDGEKIKSATGEETSNSTWARSDYIRVVPNTIYYTNAYGVGQDYTVTLYDANKNYIGYRYMVSAGTFNTDDANYVILSTIKAHVSVDELVLNLHWDGERDGEYEPYEEHSYPLDSDVTLRGIYKLDANNSLYADGDEYVADGTVTRKYEIVDLGTLTWYTQITGTNTSLFYSSVSNAKPASGDNVANVICGFAPTASINSLWTHDKYGVGVSGNGVIAVRGDAISPADFKAAMSGVYLVYELATPTTEEADPYTEIQNISNWGTEEFVSECLVPVGHETAYQPDLRAKIEVAPESPNTDGLYLMKRENGQNIYVAYLGELPSDPSEDGTYTLKCTVASGTATKTWEADT